MSFTGHSQKYSQNIISGKIFNLVALVLVAMMTLALVGTALALDVTIPAIANDEAVNHLYRAYQVFPGTVDTNNTTLSDITFATGVTGSDLVNALKADTSEIKDETAIAALSTTSSATDVAKALATLSDSAKAEKLAKVLNSFFAVSNSAPTGARQDNGSYKISNLDPGYYFIRDDQTAYKDSNDETTTTTATTKYILHVIGDTTINPKASVPTIQKQTADNTNITTTSTDLSSCFCPHRPSENCSA